jgi:hypothetical protein
MPALLRFEDFRASHLTSFSRLRDTLGKISTVLTDVNLDYCCAKNELSGYWRSFRDIFKRDRDLSSKVKVAVNCKELFLNVPR